MSRQFGLMSGSASLRGASADEPATQDNYASRDSNSSEAELERRALTFGLLIAGPFLVTSIVLFYLGFA